MKAFSMFKSLTVAFCLVELLLVGCSKPMTKSREPSNTSTGDSNSVQSEGNPELNDYAREEYEISLALGDEAADEPLALVDQAVPPPDNGQSQQTTTIPMPPTNPPPTVDGKKPICVEISAEKLAKRLARIIARLDADKSGALSEDEFSAPFAKMGLPAGILEKIKIRRKELFAKYAGDDKSLSAEEISLLIKDRHKKHCEIRQSQDNGVEAERFKSFFEGLFKKLDSDGDGKLSMDEFLAYRKTMDDLEKPIPADQHRAQGREKSPYLGRPAQQSSTNEGQ